jgi:hypothetical protein
MGDRWSIAGASPTPAHINPRGFLSPIDGGNRPAPLLSQKARPHRRAFCCSATSDGQAPHKNLIIARKTSPASTNPLISLSPKSPITCFATLPNFACYRTCMEQDGLSKSCRDFPVANGLVAKTFPRFHLGLGFRIFETTISRCGLAGRAPRWRPRRLCRAARRTSGKAMW